MEYSAIDLIGVVVQWTSGLLLLLLFYRLGRFGARRHMLRTWMAAWAAQVLSITGFLVQSVAVLARYRIGSSPILHGLDNLYLPGKLLFMGLVALGAQEAVSKRVSNRVEHAVLFGALLIGALAAMLDNRIVTGGVLLAGTLVVFVGSAAGVARAERRLHRRRVPFLAVTMFLFGVVTAFYALDDYFGQVLGPFGEFMHVVRNSSGYGDAVASAFLGAAVIILIIEDAFRAAEQARNQRVRDLAASEARLTGIIEAAREAIMTVDRDGTIELANATAEGRFLLQHGGALGRSLGEFIVEPASVIQIIEAALRASGDPHRPTATLEGTGRRSDGSWFPLEFTVGTLEVNSRSGCVVILRDLTARRAAELEREKFERHMAESEKMLAIGRIVSGVAHELNNPLTVVLGQSEHLADSSLDEEVRSGLRLINEQAHRARHIVRDLLAFVRQGEQTREPVDLVQLIQRVVAGQRGAARVRGVTLTNDVAAVLPPVVADGNAIEQVVVNLLDNALDAAQRGGSVHISLGNTGTRVEIRVEDSGAGVADHLVGRVFEPFFTTKPIGQGTGLGLAVSLSAAQRNGGTLHLENRPVPSVGARFVFALPLNVSPPIAAPPPHSRTLTLPQPPRGKDGRIAEVLLVDDEAAIRSTLARVFQRGGWAVREASTAEEGLAWLLGVAAGSEPTLVLCDLKMPGMGGRELYLHLQRERPALLSRLVFVTGDVVEESAAAFLRDASCQVVEKPFTVSEIAKAVEQVLISIGPQPESSR